MPRAAAHNLVKCLSSARPRRIGEAPRKGRPSRAATDGSYAFNKIRQELMDMGGGLTPAEVNRQAVRRIAHYEQRLRDNPDELPGESVNSLYLRDRFRASPKLRGDLSGSELRRASSRADSVLC